MNSKNTKIKLKKIIDSLKLYYEEIDDTIHIDSLIEIKVDSDIHISVEDTIFREEFHFDNIAEAKNLIEKVTNRTGVLDDSKRYTNVFLIDNKFKINGDENIYNSLKDLPKSNKKYCLILHTRDWLYLDDKNKQMPNTIGKIFLKGIDGIDQILELKKIENIEFLSKIYYTKKLFEFFPSLKELKLSNSAEFVEDECFSACKNLKTIYLPQDIIINTKTFKKCNNLKNVIYKGINILDYYRLLGLQKNGNSVMLNMIYETTKENNLTDSEIKMIRAGNKKSSYILEYFLNDPDKKEFLNNVLSEQLIRLCMSILDQENIQKILPYRILNSDNFYEFIKDKLLYIDNLSEVCFKEFNNPNVINELFDVNSIISHLDDFPDNVKFDRKFLIKLFNNRTDETTNFDNYKESLEFFKHDETIVGQFAKLVPTDIGWGENYNMKFFFDTIKWNKEDVEKIIWLTTNNINFIDLLDLTDKCDYILQLICSFETYDYEKGDWYERYQLYSPYKEITLLISDRDISMEIKDTGQSSGKIITIDKSTGLYKDICKLIKEEVKERSQNEWKVEK